MKILLFLRKCYLYGHFWLFEVYFSQKFDTRNITIIVPGGPMKNKLARRSIKLVEQLQEPQFSRIVRISLQGEQIFRIKKILPFAATCDFEFFLPIRILHGHTRISLSVWPKKKNLKGCSKAHQTHGGQSLVIFVKFRRYNFDFWHLLAVGH